MACVRALCVLFMVVIGLLCLTSTGEGLYDCCYTYTKKSLPVKIIKSFTTQKFYEVCDIDAIIFITKKFRVCANPEDKWVKNVLKALR
ncbi:hypothetical protein GDO86_010372 [Hymenochirus boettgeri]|uniref:C-C motif chemokine n=1 Tax=Hymenochirus boettgeri TaxID=247094 RepID=A0A8T2JQA5_9PIPI|nr:hypothetical protein GDO86_010372 [Hymenochirus boettgeri]